MIETPGAIVIGFSIFGGCMSVATAWVKVKMGNGKPAKDSRMADSGIRKICEQRFENSEKLIDLRFDGLADKFDDMKSEFKSLKKEIQKPNGKTIPKLDEN